MGPIHLIHWNAEEAGVRAEELRSAGFDVLPSIPHDMPALRRLQKAAPAAVVIDLSCLPSQGRDVALVLRSAKSTRATPIVFVGGAPEKVARVRETLPDATFASWRGIIAALKRAIAHPPSDPMIPSSTLAGYSGRPLPKKLGIKPGFIVATIDAPPGLPSLLGEMPPGARLVRDEGGACDLMLCFLLTSFDLARCLRTIRKRTDLRAVWLIWPKKASGVVTDLTQQDVREAGLAAGLVDYKICAVDEIWSGLLFARRKRAQGRL